MKDYSDKYSFELMEIPNSELKEISIEEFEKAMQWKVVSIESSIRGGDICIEAKNARIVVHKGEYGYRIRLFIEAFKTVNVNGDKIQERKKLSFELSERVIWGIYSYQDNKHYRIELDGNNPNLLIRINSFKE